MYYRKFPVPLYVFLFVLTLSKGVVAEAPKETIRSQAIFTSALDLLPEIDEESGKRWPKRYEEEIPVVGLPFYGFNLADVRKENYEALHENIKAQTEAVEQIGGELHLYTVAEFGEIYRVTFIMRYETFFIQNIDYQQLEKTWDEFGRIAEGYTWWAAPAEAENK